MSAATTHGSLLRGHVSKRSRGKAAKAYRLAQRRDAERAVRASYAAQRASDVADRERANRFSRAQAALDSIPPHAEAYRAEAVSCLGLFGPMIRAVARGTFGMVRSGYRLAAADQAMVDECLARLAEVFRAAAVEFDAQQHQHVVTTINKGLQDDAPGWNSSTVYGRIFDAPASRDAQGGAQ